MLWGDLLYLPVQLHLLHASVAHAAPLAVRVTICTAIATIIAMQLIYRRHISRCSATPWRDAAALTCRPWLWLCYANHMVMCAWARFFHRGFGTYVFYVGILACLSGMLMRVRATWHRAEISDKICRASFGIGLPRYTRMCLLSMLPHMLLKSAYSPMYVAIFGYSSATTAAQNGAESTAEQHWPLKWILAELLVGYAITIFYIKHGGWWYYTWHRKLHDDPVLYRAIHKWHHLHKPSLPLASGTETCLEWAGAHANPCTLSPWYIVFVQLIDTIEIENHNSASWLLSGGSQTAENHRPCTHAGTCKHCLRRRERWAAPGQRLPPQAPPHAARQLRHRDRARLRREGGVGAGVGRLRSAIRFARGWSGEGHAATSARGGPLPLPPQPQHHKSRARDLHVITGTVGEPVAERGGQIDESAWLLDLDERGRRPCADWDPRGRNRRERGGYACLMAGLIFITRR